MVDAWPDTLPQCLIIGYSEENGDGLIETQPDMGPPISRRRTSSYARKLSGQMRMTRAQIAILRTFLNVTLAGGSLPFSFPDPTADGSLLVKFGKGNLPSWQQSTPGTYRVSINLILLP